MRLRTAALTAVVLAGLAFAAGCSEELAGQQQTLGRAELEKQIKDAVAKEVGKVPKAIRCPGAIDNKEGARTRCTLIANDGSEVGVNVRVDVREEGDAADLVIKVDDKVRSGPKTVRRPKVEKLVKAKLEKSVGQVLKGVRCRSAIKAREGARTRCTVVAEDDSEIGVDVRVDRVERTGAILDIELDDERSK